jgi:hypothetical protein
LSIKAENLEPVAGETKKLEEKSEILRIAGLRKTFDNGF